MGALLVFGAVTFKAMGWVAMEWVADWGLVWKDALGYTSFANEVKGHLISPFCPHACVQYVYTKCSFAVTYCATVYVYIGVCLAVHQLHCSTTQHTV